MLVVPLVVSFEPPEGTVAPERLVIAKQKTLNRWPARYTGPWTTFAAFPREIDPATWLPRAAARSEWNAAVLNRWFIPYNFSPKLEWPDAEAGGS